MAYNPLRDPNSAYNNPKKGPHASGAPGGGIPLRGPLSPEQHRWMSMGKINHARAVNAGQPVGAAGDRGRHLYSNIPDMTGLGGAEMRRRNAKKLGKTWYP